MSIRLKRIRLHKRSAKRSKRSAKRSKRSAKRSKRSAKRSYKRSAKRRPKKKYNRVIDGMFDEEGEHLIKGELIEPYGKEIYDAYRIKEENPNCFPLLLRFDKQIYINDKMIKKLVDWINTDLFIGYKVPRVYFYNTINYLKRFINITPNIRDTKLQLIGTLCFILSVKFDDRYPKTEYLVNIKDFVPYITDEAYTPEESVAMEWNIFRTLDHEMNIPEPKYFFDIYISLIPLTPEEIEKAKFLLEFPNFMFMESYLPSVIALAAILLSKKINYSELSEDIKEFIDLNKDEIDLLYKYIGYLKIFYTAKFNGDYKDSIENLFK